jgi:hypothetical protein
MASSSSPVARIMARAGARSGPLFMMSLRMAIPGLVFARHSGATRSMEPGIGLIRPENRCRVRPAIRPSGAPE